MRRSRLPSIGHAAGRISPDSDRMCRQAKLPQNGTGDASSSPHRSHFPNATMKRSRCKGRMGRWIGQNRTPSPSTRYACEAGVELEGSLAVPEAAPGVVLFAHGSGSSRHSPRNQYVARVLRKAGLGTLLMDLLTDDEESVDQYTRHLRFDIELLTHALIGATDWLRQHPPTRELADRLLRCQYRGRGGTAGSGRASRRGPGRGVARRPSRPGRAGADARPCADAPHRRRRRRAGDRPQRTSDGTARRPRRSCTSCPGATHLFEEPGRWKR